MDMKNHCIFATLPCETLISAKQALNDKLQRSEAAYLSCGGVVNNQIKNGLMLSLWLKKMKSVNIWQSYKQKSDCLSCTFGNWVKAEWLSGLWNYVFNVFFRFQ